jgi:hypothetical protein
MKKTCGFKEVDQVLERPSTSRMDIWDLGVPQPLHNPHLVQLIKPFKEIQGGLERGESVRCHCLGGMATYYLTADGFFGCVYKVLHGISQELQSFVQM